MDNADINKMMMDKGVEILPITLIDGQIKKTAAYPTNAEISEWLNVPLTMLEESENENKQESGGCCGEPATEQTAGCCGGESSEGCC
ncbi:arsenic metallochaperone ArsD family protein [Christensenellaceae bacterium OttesenSCG-928-K19]|nr:arsenic metallochaperone ArsD family protein [Christensenellaceae bacterium OttesenSCG-928-K19]